jgi:hypothetical protein
LINKIRRYIEYNIDLKRSLKIEEKELMQMVNDDLRIKIKMYLNGKILESVDIFSEFPIEFLSNLTFVFQMKSYVLEEYVF